MLPPIDCPRAAFFRHWGQVEPMVEKGPGTVVMSVRMEELRDEHNDIVIGECLTRQEAEEIITVLAQEAALQDLLVEAQLRSDQHRQNYVKLKGEHERLLQQLTTSQTEVTRLEAEKLDLEQEIRSAIRQ